MIMVPAHCRDGTPPAVRRDHDHLASAVTGYTVPSSGRGAGEEPLDRRQSGPRSRRSCAKGGTPGRGGRGARCASEVRDCSSLSMVTRKAASKSTPYAAASVITAHRQSASSWAVSYTHLRAPRDGLLS